MFIVHDSTGPGTGTVRSYGQVSGNFPYQGDMGPVTPSTDGLSSTTFETDSNWWGKDYNTNDVTFTLIPASDFNVELAADSLISEHRYGLFGINSNAAAQAIANHAAGATATTPPGFHPGVGSADKVNFVRGCPVP